MAGGQDESKVSTPAATSGGPAVSSTLLMKISKYIQHRERYFASVNSTYDLIKSVDTRSSEFLARASRIQSSYDGFESAQAELMTLNAQVPAEHQVDVKQPAVRFDEMFYKIVAVQTDLIKHLNEKQHNATQNAQPTEVPQKARVPKITIEPFQGQIEKFQSFKSLYDTLIHSTSMSKIEKFSYLKSLLQGKAAQVIEHIEFSEANYEFAYNRLSEEYSNKRLVGHHYLNKLFSLKPHAVESSESLRQFVDTFQVNAKALQDLCIPNFDDFILLHLALKNIPVDTRKLFENENISKSGIPTLGSLFAYLKNRIAILEISGDTKKNSSSNSNAGTSHASQNVKKSFMAANATPENKNAADSNQQVGSCPQCKSAHKLAQCSQFLALQVPDRYEVVKGAKLCFGCFGRHNRGNCKSTYSCRKCGKRSHHSLLHISKSESSSTSQSSKPSSDPAVSATPVQVTTNSDSLVALSEPPRPSLNCSIPNVTSARTVLLGTAIAKIQDNSGVWHSIRLVIDPGSMVNFITSSLAQTLGLPKYASSTQISGIGQSKVQSVKGAVNISIKPQDNNGDNYDNRSVVLNLAAEILPDISSSIPSSVISPSVASRFSNLKLADYSIFKQSSKVDVLIGASHFSKIISSQSPVIQGEPSCIPTIFGYVLMGEVDDNGKSTQCTSLFTAVEEVAIDELLRQFWQAESIPDVTLISPEDKACEQHFEDTHYRDESGRFVVSLPFKGGEAPELGSTRSVALQRFKSLENRLNRDQKIKKLYHENINDYVLQDQLVHASTPSDYVLPHHAVVKEDSLSHPVRVVFNASQPSNLSKTLNQTLLVGPKLQNNVDDIVLLFRLFVVPLCADIKQMYRAIVLHPPDRKYQHIFWRFHETDEIQEWELTRLTFGFTPASYLAQKCIRKLAETELKNSPEACQVLFENSYVDDIITGAETVEDARRLRGELVQVLQSGGFELRKFCSSAPEVLSDLNPNENLENVSLQKESIKVLGLEWEPTSDSFRYTFNPKSDVITKRSLLSNAASIYDINGYLAHLVIFIKILIQRLWLARIDWDSKVPPAIEQDWNTFLSELPLLKDLRIPRHVASFRDCSYQLVGFSDASGSAMAASFYLRVISPNGEVQCFLLRAKSKVAPLKVLSIPRLELCAAYLLIRLLSTLQFLIKKLKISEIWCFTDSTTVLSWVETPPHQLKTFVANRVSEIITHTSPNQWRHVPTALNPVDLATRGLLPSQVMEHYNLWFSGPSFLLEAPENWPRNPASVLPEVPELRSSAKVILMTQELKSSANDMHEFIQRFSSFSKLRRVVAWIKRFVNNCRKKKENRVHGFLTSHEYSEAERYCVRVSQRFHLADVIKTIESNKPYVGPLHGLSPFVSRPSGLLMVGGRLGQAPLPESSRHPVILHRESHLAKLIVDHFHMKTLHGGPQLVQSLVRKQYWIPNLRSLIRHRIFKCLRCYKLAAKPTQPYMGDLPSTRFQQGRPFIHVGLDFGGPYSLKDGNRRNSPIVKAYIALFVCMSTKCIHLELVSSLSTEACLAAFDRFIARRGCPSRLFSDCGTNFKGCARYLSETQEFLSRINSDVSKFCSNHQITWTFHPPGAPNFSGLAEAGIKSAKSHLKRVLSDQALRYEEFYTLLVKVEAVLNSRPMYALPSTVEDNLDYLSPGHFLIGAPLLERPELDLSEQYIPPGQRWKLISKSVQSFWKRWRDEYIHTLIQRPKWTKISENLQKGNLVLLYSENTAPLDWPLGRVTDLHPGADGVVRVVTVKTGSGTFTRSVNKLVPLPVAEF